MAKREQCMHRGLPQTVWHAVAVSESAGVALLTLLEQLALPALWESYRGSELTG